MRFNFASCSHWEKGYFSAYRDMADKASDYTIFLGDYFYEYPNQGAKAEGLVRHHGAPDAFLHRRAAAYKAFYEHMPLRPMSLPQGPDMRVYDRFRFAS